MPKRPGRSSSATIARASSRSVWASNDARRDSVIDACRRPPPLGRPHPSSLESRSAGLPPLRRPDENPQLHQPRSARRHRQDPHLLWPLVTAEFSAKFFAGLVSDSPSWPQWSYAVCSNSGRATRRSSARQPQVSRFRLGGHRAAADRALYVQEAGTDKPEFPAGRGGCAPGDARPLIHQ
jgi:hypothetical protein